MPVNAPSTITLTGSPLGAAAAAVVAGASVAGASVDTAAESLDDDASAIVVAGAAAVVGAAGAAVVAAGAAVVSALSSSSPHAAINSTVAERSATDFNRWARTFMASPLPSPASVAAQLYQV